MNQNKKETYHKPINHHNTNPISISTSTPISTINPTNVNATTTTTSNHTSTTKQQNNTNQIQAALHAIERFNEQARQQQQQPPSSPHLINSSSSSSSATTNIDQKLNSRTSNSNLELGLRTMTPPGLPTPTNTQSSLQSTNPITPSALSSTKPIPINTTKPEPTQPKATHPPPSISRNASQGRREKEAEGTEVGTRDRSGSEASSTTSMIDHEHPVDLLNGSKPSKTRSSRGRRKSTKSNPTSDSPPEQNIPELDRPNLNLVTDLQVGLKTIYSGKAEDYCEKDPKAFMNHHKTDHQRTSSITSTQDLPTGLSRSKLIQYDPKLDPGSPISVIHSKIASLPLPDQLSIKRTLASIPSPQPPTNGLPLHDAWRLFFSDTSPTSSTSAPKTPSSSRSTHLKAAEYQSGMSVVFNEIKTVESLCESLVGLKRFIGSRCRGFEWLEGPGKGVGLVALKAQQNLHFFRCGVGPVWEDPWNAKGGRLTISLSLSTLDPIFESLILLTAGGVIEHDTQPIQGGKIVGIVGSRRSRGDRIEIWLAGVRMGEAPREEWVRGVVECLGREVGEVFRGVKFKRHL